jgi:hypothetical protein
MSSSREHVMAIFWEKSDEKETDLIVYKEGLKEDD